MTEFQITLINEKEKFYDRFAIFVFVLNAIGSCIALLYSPNPLLGKYVDYALLGTVLVSCSYAVVVVNKKTLKSIFFFGAVVIMILFWVIAGFWWVGLILLLLVFLYNISQKDLLVLVTKAGIDYPSFPKRRILWDELNNMLLKDELLTIDFKNNKVIQQLLDERSGNVNEKEFNDFCREQLRKAGSSI